MFGQKDDKWTINFKKGDPAPFEYGAINIRIGVHKGKFETFSVSEEHTTETLQHRFIQDLLDAAGGFHSGKYKKMDIELRVNNRGDKFIKSIPYTEHSGPRK